MKIFSELTNKEYATVEDCVKAEKEYNEAVAAKKAAEEKALAEVKAKNEKMATERKTDADKVEEARKKMVEANKAYHQALADFCSKWGAYHTSFKVKPGQAWTSLFDDIFNPFWF